MTQQGVSAFLRNQSGFGVASGALIRYGSSLHRKFLIPFSALVAHRQPAELTDTRRAASQG